MKLSKILSTVLLGAVAMTNVANAAGTTAGTEISNAPTLSYEMSGTAKTATVEASSYIVDKVINFTLERVEADEQNLVVGTTKMVSFKLSNLGNSVENFSLTANGGQHEFDFSKQSFYVDADNSGVLEASEKVDTSLVSSVAMDGSTTIWMEVASDAAETLSRVNWEGVLAQAVDASSNPYTASIANDVAVEDIVFADGGSTQDDARDGKVVTHYKWITIENPDNVKLDVSPLTDEPAVVVTHDPVNGTTNPVMIPGATVVKRWTIKNNTSTVAKDVVFSVAIDSTKEQFAANEDNTWYAGRGNGANYVWNNTTRTVTAIQGVIDGDTITYTIPEIKAGEDMWPHLVTEVK